MDRKEFPESEKVLKPTAQVFITLKYDSKFCIVGILIGLVCLPLSVFTIVSYSFKKEKETTENRLV